MKKSKKSKKSNSWKIKQHRDQFFEKSSHDEVPSGKGVTLGKFPYLAKAKVPREFYASTKW